jgi:hypothetical protein
MSLHSAPELVLDYICVTSKADASIAALLSSYFSDPGVYFIVLTFPNVESAHRITSDFDADDYISQIVGTTAAIRINNVMARLRPRNVLLAGLTPAQKTYIRAYLPSRMIIDVDVDQDVERTLAVLPKSFDGTVACKSSEIIQGLVLAKYTNRRLVIDETAPSLPHTYLTNNKGVVVIENNGTSDEVVAVNYAFSVGASVFLVKPISRAECEPLQLWLYEWKVKDSTSAYQALREMLTIRTDGINFPEYDFGTFFTRGFPYGLLLNNVIPFSHVLIHPGCDLFILNNIGTELFTDVSGSALVFSPRRFQREETDDLIKALKESNYLVRALLGKSASLYALTNYGQHFPFDLMHICSHGGETDGYHVVQEFTGRDGHKHTIEYEEIVGFSPAEGDQMLVVRKALFRRLDGLKWMSEELKKQQIPKYVYEDMRKALSLRHDSSAATVQRKKVDTPIHSSCHIECFDSIHQGEFRSLASNSSPVIFNNTCSSWHEIAVSFIDAGARAYFGTLWKVDNSVAREAARTFYEQVLETGSLLGSFYEMTRAIQNSKYRNIYLFWGLHFSTVKSPKNKPDQEVFNALLATLVELRAGYNSATDPKLRDEYARTFEFIRWEITTNFTPSHLSRLNAEIEGRLALLDQPSSRDDQADEDLGSRGVIDL